MGKKSRIQRSAGTGSDKKYQPSEQFQFASTIRAAADGAARFFSSYRIPAEILAVLFLIAAGIFFRLEDLSAWKKVESRTFFKAQPLHTTFDAYFYLSLSKDLIDGTYSPIDEKRGIPDSPPRPSPPPLISVLAAQITKLSGWPLGWVGAVLPAVLAGLLALPLYLLMRYYSGGLAGFTAALLALLYPFFVFRSGLGRFDTDCLNVTFILTSAYLFLRFALVAGWQRYIYFAIALINYGLFLWWWDQTPAVVTAITFLPFAVALAFYYRPSKKEAGFFAAGIALALTLVVAIKGPAVFIQMFNALLNQFLYISKDGSGSFPNIGLTISEQTIPPVSKIIEYTVGSLPAFIFALTGIGYLVFRRFKESLFLATIFILSFLAFTYANRFIIFLVPLLAIGSGYLLGELWKLRNRFLPLFIICPLLFLYLVVPLYRENAASAQFPKLTAHTVEGMDAAMHKTPPDSVIWAWWDNGYALTYFARRATVNDGSIHSGERTYCNALPLALNDFRLSANFMHFYVIRGMSGINRFSTAARRSKQEALEFLKKLLAAGPAEARLMLNEAYFTGKLEPFPCTGRKDGFGWLPFLFPAEKRPVYLFLDTLLTRVAYWWYWFGTWNPDTRDGIHPYYQTFGSLQMKNSVITGSRGLRINTDTGEIRVEGQTFRLAGVSIRTRSGLKHKKYYASSKYYFEYNQPGRYGALADKNIAESVFNKLFFRNDFDETYFKPVVMHGMISQLWEVIADSYDPDAFTNDE